MKNRPVLAVLLAVALSAAGLFAMVAGHSAAVEPAVARPIDWGLYYMRWSRDYHDALRREVDAFASSPDYLMFFVDLRIPYRRQRVEAVAEVGAEALVSFELTKWHGGRSESYLPAIVAGEYDEFLRQWARDAKEHGRRLLLRFGYEFNGNWFTWAGDPESYVAAWRRAHAIFAEEGADNVEWVWSPNVVSCPDTPKNDMHRYWPGAEYVDWIGIDGYNFGAHHDQWHTWEPFERVYDKTLTDLERRYPHTRLMLSEFGCAPGEPGQRAAWIRQAFAYLQRHPRVEAALWFNHDKSREGEPNWKLTSADGSLAAFNETFAQPKTLP
jgi:hypothetical protein